MTPWRSIAKYIKAMRAHTRFATEYLSNTQRLDRERDTVRALLRALGIAFEPAEIKAPQPEPTDVAFRDARFQILYLPERGSRLHQEWKLRRERADRARSIAGANRRVKGIPEWTGQTTPMSLSELIATVTGALVPKSRHYGPAGCGDLDALVYADLTRTRALDADSPPGDNTRLMAQGWRSVSIVFEPFGLVLFARPTAPVFLTQAAGTPLRRWTDPDGLFAR